MEASRKLVEVDKRFGDWEDEWGCDLVVGIGVGVGKVWAGLYLICGIVAVRAQWSLWLVAVDLMVVSVCLWLAVGGRRRSQWSSGVLEGR